MINASSELLSPALPKNNGQGLILWRKATVSKCFRRLENENNTSLRQHLTACPSSYEENTAIRWHFRNDNIARMAIGRITAAE